MKKKIIIGIILVIVGVVALFVFDNSFLDTKFQKKQLIFIGVDGVNVDEYNKIFSQNKFPNFQKLVGTKGIKSEALITGHAVTETAPGNVELHTGLSAEITRVFNNACGGTIPGGKTIFERLAGYNSDIKIGSIYGKETCYLSVSLFKDAKKVILWWQDKKTYTQKNYLTSTCTDSVDVATKASEFLNEHKDESFYLFVYFGVPDCTGHAFGVPSTEYENSLINVDTGLGIILENIESFSKSPQIIISGDHGWNPNTKGHSTPNFDTRRIILMSNNSNLINGERAKKQCDIAPTILDYFGMKSEQYQDIVDGGCGSLNQ
jgi:predicted AlkP superfamily pyrophosphatase or phosphodiesterase